MNLFIRILGTMLLLSGLVLTIKPDLFGKYLTPVNAYQIIEKRVKWGLLIGTGMFFVFYGHWNSWGLIVSAALTALTLGVVLARLTGFVLDGFFTKQLWWLLIELVVLILSGFLYWKQSK